MGARTKSIILILFTLLTGVGIGLWAGGRIFEQRVEKIRSVGREDGLRHFLRNELELTPEQEEQVKQILKIRMPRMRAVHEDFFEKRQKEVDSLNAEILPLLTPEQQEKWSRHREGMPMRNHKRRPNDRRPGNRPPPPPIDQ